MSVYGRPQRTVRAIESILKQTINGWEAYITGDGCPQFFDLISSHYFEDLKKQAVLNGNILHISNLDPHKGGFGYQVINTNRMRALGKYFVFVDNDDVILPNHFENYLSGIEGTDNDLVFFDSFIEPDNRIRISKLEEGHIGHSEIIVKTDCLRYLKPHVPQYGHDWYFIREMIERGFKCAKAEGKPQTYIVKGTPAKREQGID